MPETQRPRRFDDIASLSKKPPAKASASPFVLAHDAEEARPRVLSKVTAADFPGIPEATPAPKLDIQPPLDIQGPVAIQPSLDIQKLAIQPRVDIQSPLDIQDIQPPPRKRQKEYPSRRDTEALYVRLPIDLVEDIRRWCFERRLFLTDFFSDAVKAKLRGLDIQKPVYIQSGVDINISTIDDDFTADDLATINLYEKLTRNTASAADRACFSEYRRLGNDVIQLALLEGRKRKRGQPISSFRYFEKIIIEVAGWAPDKITKDLAFRKHELEIRRPR